MHFAIFVEDRSGATVLNHLVPKIILPTNTFDIKSYQGIGHIPKNMSSIANASKRLLLQNLPGILQGYGHMYSGSTEVMVVIVCDLDANDEQEFIGQLHTIHEKCDPQPIACFCLAIEEIEAWLLGDKDAVKTAYPKCVSKKLSAYNYDSICGTWEALADIVYRGGSTELKQKCKQYSEIGRQKNIWADTIAPHIDVDRNRSPSFCFFRDTLRRTP